MTNVVDKFAELNEKGTNGVNCGLMTEDIIAKLKDWDRRYGVQISDVDYNHVMVQLGTIPEELDDFTEEVYQFCPDVVDQHLAALWCGYINSEPPPEIADLLGDLDPDAEGYGLEMLKRWILRERPLPLWWD